MRPAIQLEGSECFGYRVFCGDSEVISFKAESEDEAFRTAARLAGVRQKAVARRMRCNGFRYQYTLRPPLWRRVLSIFGV